MRLLLLCCLIVVINSSSIAADDAVRVLDGALHHLRIEGPREWSEFPEHPEAEKLDVRFSSEPNSEEWTLGLRQQDVKQNWSVLLNGQRLGQLVVDENDMRIYFSVPKGAVTRGENRLEVQQQTGPRSRPR